MKNKPVKPGRIEKAASREASALMLRDHIQVGEFAGDIKATIVRFALRERKRALRECLEIIQKAGCDDTGNLEQQKCAACVAREAVFALSEKEGRGR